ncbi:MAG: methyltransferase domain-containing protein [Alphaproteobacteria bacterium]|nr:methyltransferase domain-containing protein [Alphaproteobacteria bacterium]MBF0249121.1 methyltransferase domain-containing protein [Alphaproteobacteria bacterium]
MDLKEVEILGSQIKDHWYYASKASALSAALRNIRFSRVMDVGAGSGFFSRYLLSTGKADEALCVDNSYPEDSNQVHEGKEIAFRRSVGNEHADIVLMMDVLEHVDDDTQLIVEYARKVASGTYFFVSVPAFEFLWSSHDVFLEHKRRYTLSGLEVAVKASELDVVETYYYFAGVFPIAAALRLLGRFQGGGAADKSQLKRHSPLTNAVLSAICRMERPFMKYNRMFGLSVFCLARKK